MKKVLPILLCLCVLISAAVLYANRPISNDLTVDRLEENMRTDGRMVLLYDTCYELDPACNLAEYCDFSHWYEGNGREAGNRILTVQLGDQYELAFYENGWVQAYNGYASWPTRGTVWYKVTEQNTEDMIDYIRANGVIKEPFLGPESWFVLDD